METNELNTSRTRKVCKESTSWSTLSADTKLSHSERIKWLIFNAINNSLPEINVDPNLIRSKFCLSVQEMESLWNLIPENATPSRRLCDFFWHTTDWKQIYKKIGPVRILEVGCGSGHYGRLLKKLVGSHFEHYLGVDVDKNSKWEISDSSISFFQARASDVGSILRSRGPFNLIITQSALEHFAEDLEFFRQIALYINECKLPLIQMHLCPSAQCFWTYPWHGIREYSPRTISRISSIYSNQTTSNLVTIGGKHCNEVHRNTITFPNLLGTKCLKDTNPNAYANFVKSALISDMKNTACRRPAFYALVMQSFLDNDFSFIRHTAISLKNFSQ